MRRVFVTSVLAVANLLLAGCAPVLLDPQGEADVAGRSNWADQDTNGVGTHRVVADALNVRDAQGNVVGLAANGQQLVTTRATYESSGYTYYEAVFKGGDLDGVVGWVAGDFLRYSELQVCGGSGISVRSTSDLGTVIGAADAGDAFFVVSSTVRNTGQHRYFEGSVNGVRGYVATDHLCAKGRSGDNAASRILDDHDLGVTTLWDQTFGRFDGASPLDNIEDAAAGRPARTSCYGGAPCGEVYLDERLLDAMVDLVDVYGYSTFVTSIAGASHSANSYHYAGRAFDIDTIDGVRVYGDSSLNRAFMNACWALGAVEVFGPSNDPHGHYDHIHCAF